MQGGAGPLASRGAARHLPGLDGLRGLAVASVVAYHLGWLPGGFLGVDVFFVLSGYLVTSLVLSEVERTGRLDLIGFWGRRLRRLAPAVLVMVPVVLVAALAVGWTPSRLGALVTDALATLTWWANWRQAGGASYWAPSPSPFRHAWSLSIEEQFYVLWPIVVTAAVFVGRRLGWSVRRLVGVVASGGVVAGGIWMTVLARSLPASGLSRVYVGTDTRFLAPLAGCALACWWSPDRASRMAGLRWVRRSAVVLGHIALAGLAVMVATVHVPDPGLYRAGGFLIAAVAAAAVVAAVVLGDGLGAGHTGGLSSVARQPLRHLGTRSYAIYLWSWPAQVLVQARQPEWSRTQVTLAVLVLTAIAAELSFFAIEDPFRRARGWLTRPAVRRPAWAMVVVLPILAMVLAHGRAEPVPAFERIDTAASVEQASQAPPPPTPSETSVPAGEVAPLRVMVEGDSTAFTAVYNAPGRSALPKDIASIDGRGVIGCGLLAESGWEYPRRDEPGYEAPAAGACKKQADAERIGLTGRPDVVLVMAGAWEYQSARSPEGSVVEAQSPAMADALVDALLGRARAADRVGAQFAIAQWACPGSHASPERRDPAYVRWVNGVFARAVRAAHREGIEARVIPVAKGICADGDPLGSQTAEWAAATEHEVHVRNPEGGAYLWGNWFGPALASAPPS